MKSRILVTLLGGIALGGTACVTVIPPRDLSEIRVGMTEAQVQALWGEPTHMYKLDESAEGCIERHHFGTARTPGGLPRPANVDFDAQRRVCAVGKVEIRHSEAPLLAAEIAVPRPPPPQADAPSPDDTVFLKDGGRIRGKVMEESPQKGVSIRLADGTTKLIPQRDVAKVEYAK